MLFPHLKSSITRIFLNNSRISSGPRTVPSRCASIVSWRERKGLPRCGNEYGPLTDLPDWSYLDGRPAPLGSKQKMRYLKQREYAQKIMEYTAEIDFAVERHRKLQEAARLSREETLAGKLRPKRHSWSNRSK